MKFKFLHNNINVRDLARSLAFYEKALGLKEVSRVEMPDFTLVYLGDGGSTHKQPGDAGRQDGEGEGVGHAAIVQAVSGAETEFSRRLE